MHPSELMCGPLQPLSEQKSADVDLAPTVNVRPRAIPATIESVIFRITSITLPMRVALQFE